ncbi:MAG: hypothetical protein ABEJ65_08110 [bacterium]
MIFRCIAILLFTPVLVSGVESTPPLVDSLRNQLEVYQQRRMEDEPRIPLRLDSITSLYVQRNYKPAWTKDHKLSRAGIRIVSHVRDSKGHGFRPEDYHLDRIESLLPVNELDESHRARLEILLTDALFGLAEDYAHGRLKPDNSVADLISSTPPPVRKKLFATHVLPKR